MRTRRRHISATVGVMLLAASCSHPAVDNVAFMRSDGITIEFGVDTCNADLEATVVESETTVEVTITAENDTTDECRDHIVLTLDDPLADRRLVNGSTGDAFEVRLVPPSG